MYKCACCGATFVEPEITSWTENHGDGLFEPWVAQVCPFCGSDEIAETEVDYD